MSVNHDILDALSGDLRSIVSQLLEEEPVAIEDLRAEVEGYLGELERRSETEEFVDLEAANNVGARLMRLLDSAPGCEEHSRALHAAARYFVMERDEGDDTYVLTGFADDLTVVKVVEDRLRR